MYRCALIGLLFVTAASAAEIEMGPHALLGCKPCHVTNAEGRAIGPVSLIHDQEQICLPCHDGVVGPLPRPHPFFTPIHPLPSDFPSFHYPKHLLPGAFPLDTQGRVTCSTCHDVHSDSPVLLRSAATFWTCQPCHPER